jgi:hypothetical protein
LEDDVTRIELQAVSGAVLAAIGLWYDDYVPGSPNPVTPQLVNVLTYSTGITRNDAPFQETFPYEAQPWAGTHICDCEEGAMPVETNVPGMNLKTSQLGMAVPDMVLSASPNPAVNATSIRYRLAEKANLQLAIYDAAGKPVKLLMNKEQEAGSFSIDWNMNGLPKGTYFITAKKNGVVTQTTKVVKN